MGEIALFKYLQGQPVEKGVLCIAPKGKTRSTTQHRKDRVWFNICLSPTGVSKHGYFVTARKANMGRTEICLWSLPLGTGLRNKEMNPALGLTAKFKPIKNGLTPKALSICSLGKKTARKSGRPPAFKLEMSRLKPWPCYLLSL